MQKDITPKPMEPFTLEEEQNLVDKLDALSAASLESYLVSARAALANNALAATWRPRIEFGARYAEQALTKAQTAAPDPIAVAPAAKVLATRSRKSAPPVADEESERVADEG